MAALFGLEISREMSEQGGKDAAFQK